MSEALPIVLIPGLLCTPELYAPQIPVLWRFGPVMVAGHTRDDSMAGIARRILADAPPRFVLMGLSMGGYAALEIMRQAPERVARLGRESTRPMIADCWRTNASAPVSSTIRRQRDLSASSPWRPGATISG